MEISAILREQLSHFKTEAELEEVGTVLQIGDGIARVYGLTKVRSGELVVFENGTKAIVLNLEEDNVGVVLMGNYDNIKEGDTVRRTNQIASIQVERRNVRPYCLMVLANQSMVKALFKANCMKCLWKEKPRVLFTVSR